MSHHDDDARLRGMLEYARKAVAAIGGRARAELDQDEILGAALERFVEIVGEAANRVSEERKRHTPQIPWRQIVGMRNRLIRGYVAVDYDILWHVVHDDLPSLIERVEEVLAASD
ncbi:MAG: DUF86 domain-containing protein [Phycisphaerae bacterium]|jgi:uncharacterized protein with HEPN domain